MKYFLIAMDTTSIIIEYNYHTERIKMNQIFKHSVAAMATYMLAIESDLL